MVNEVVAVVHDYIGVTIALVNTITLCISIWNVFPLLLINKNRVEVTSLDWDLISNRIGILTVKNKSY